MLGIKFSDETSLTLAENTTIAASRFMLEKRSYGDAEAVDGSLW